MRPIIYYPMGPGLPALNIPLPPPPTPIRIWPNNRVLLAGKAERLLVQLMLQVIWIVPYEKVVEVEVLEF